MSRTYVGRSPVVARRPLPFLLTLVAALHCAARLANGCSSSVSGCESSSGIMFSTCKELQDTYMCMMALPDCATEDFTYTIFLSSVESRASELMCLLNPPNPTPSPTTSTISSTPSISSTASSTTSPSPSVEPLPYPCETDGDIIYVPAESVSSLIELDIGTADVKPMAEDKSSCVIPEPKLQQHCSFFTYSHLRPFSRSPGKHHLETCRVPGSWYLLKHSSLSVEVESTSVNASTSPHTMLTKINVTFPAHNCSGDQQRSYVAVASDPSLPPFFTDGNGSLPGSSLQLTTSSETLTTILAVWLNTSIIIHKYKGYLSITLQVPGDFVWETEGLCSAGCAMDHMHIDENNFIEDLQKNCQGSANNAVLDCVMYARVFNKFNGADGGNVVDDSSYDTICQFDVLRAWNVDIISIIRAIASDAQLLPTVGYAPAPETDPPPTLPTTMAPTDAPSSSSSSSSSATSAPTTVDTSASQPPTTTTTIDTSSGSSDSSPTTHSLTEEGSSGTTTTTTTEEPGATSQFPPEGTTATAEVSSDGETTEPPRTTPTGSASSERTTEPTVFVSSAYSPSSSLALWCTMVVVACAVCVCSR